jgi:putative transposase
MFARRSSRRHRRRFNLPGHAHSLTFSCYSRIPFLDSERTCLWLRDAIDEARVEQAFELWAYVFMPEHVHLLVHPRRVDYDIALILQAIKEPVGRRAIGFLERHSRVWLRRVTRQRGNRVERLFWQSGGGYDRNIETPAVLQAEIQYIHMNPVRRGLVQRAVDWKWSSAGHYELGIHGPLAIDPIPWDWVN